KNLQKVDAYHGRVRTILPNLVDVLTKTHAEDTWDARIDGLDAAWRWAQAHSWLTHYLRDCDVSALDKRSVHLAEQTHQCMTRLAANLAWSHFLSPMDSREPRLNDDHRRHMQAWKLAMSKLGKGTGKTAPKWRRDAQQHLNACREAVPAWVMPLHR